jgi:hypothetical protein
MRAYIKKLQGKEEHVRKQILFVSMTVSMVVVVFVWIYGLGYKLNNRPVVAKAESEIKPFTLFANSVSSAYQNITASVGNIPSVSKLMNQEKEKPEKQIELIPVE